MVKFKYISGAFYALTAACTVSLAACGSAGGTQSAHPAQTDAQPAERNEIKFNADSAFSLVRQQVDMGPRVPGTDAHARCTQWIVDKLGQFSDTVTVQRAEVTQLLTGQKFGIANVMGRIRPQATKRILLIAHYDTRATADEEIDPDRRNTPIDGANDGASGVAVILELGRVVAADTALAGLGLDMLLVDAEDSGLSDSSVDTNETWSLGARYWAENLPYSRLSERPVAGIVLDMVGGRQARFHREYFSNRMAGQLVDKVWNAAVAEGVSDRFPNRVGGPIIDDHLPILEAGIPCIDIVENQSDVTGSFPPTWHTLEDNIRNIDSQTLDAVGRTVLRYLRTAAR